VHSGLHAVADLEGLNAEAVWREASSRNIESMPLSAYFVDRARAACSLLLGFGSISPPAIRAGVSQLTLAIDAVRRE
jgi:DNA-binding transcriptional MocR family regulator